jgi:hypothetical protein
MTTRRSRRDFIKLFGLLPISCFAPRLVKTETPQKPDPSTMLHIRQKKQEMQRIRRYSTEHIIPSMQEKAAEVMDEIITPISWENCIAAA